ncbi:unnamed protein product [Dracunculus medinensis]|uniref:Uncharacterized protein n=1 Tax=Dracunculus medinensis TaxID=318479 RepID=A0A3P7PBG3_DRAME|nr:unnamed protein product [Dracunculus medinensis]
MKIALIDCAIWAHHIYTVGKNSCAYFAATIVIAVPIGAKDYFQFTLFWSSILDGSMFLIDHNFNTFFLDSSSGGNTLSYQHLFWFFWSPRGFNFACIVRQRRLYLTGK